LIGHHDSPPQQTERGDAGVATYVYARDDAQRTIRITASVPLSLADCRAIVDRQAAEGTWQYGLLYDMTRLTAAMPPEDAERLAAHIGSYVPALGRRGPVAVVARSPAVVGGAQWYAFNTKPAAFAVEVFWDLGEAEQWLAARLSGV
jgi:hypothetical protein